MNTLNRILATEFTPKKINPSGVRVGDIEVAAYGSRLWDKGDRVEVIKVTSKGHRGRAMIIFNNLTDPDGNSSDRDGAKTVVSHDAFVKAFKSNE